MSGAQPERPSADDAACASKRGGVPCVRKAGHRGSHFAPHAKPCDWTEAEADTGHELPADLVAWLGGVSADQAAELVATLQAAQRHPHLLELLMLYLRARSGSASAQAEIAERAERQRGVMREGPVGVVADRKGMRGPWKEVRDETGRRVGWKRRPRR